MALTGEGMAVRDSERPIVCGAIVELGPGSTCRVRLDADGEVSACIPRQIARLMFRVVPGDRVRVQPWGSGGYIVLGHERVGA